MNENTIRIKYSIALGLLRAFAFLPLFLLYRLSDLAYVIVYYIIRYRRSTVRLNLTRSFPKKDDKDIKRIERGYYRHLCDLVVETVKLLHISDKEIDRRVVVNGGDYIEQLAADGRPIVAYLGHYGNWEWVQAVSRHYARPAISCQVYRPLHDEAIGRLMLTIRSRFATTSIPQKQAFRTLLKWKQNGKQFMVGFISDQRPNSSNLNHWTEFLHQDTAYSPGGDEIGRRIDAHFVYLDIEKTARGHYRMTFLPLSPAKDEVENPYTVQFMRMLEAKIRHAPEYWLWSHKRWRFARQS